MNALQAFIQSKPCGFLKDTDMPALIALDRLCPVIVRCGGCRFTCAAQDVAHLLKCIAAGKDYVRDVSFPAHEIEEARAFVAALPQDRPAEQPATAWSLNRPKPVTHPACKRIIVSDAVMFNEGDCGGAFDGFQVTSDADPGL